MKAAIVTWITYYNFGTYLQAFALQYKLEQLGVENEIISDKEIINNTIAKAAINGITPNAKRDLLKKIIYCLKRIGRGMLWLISPKRRKERKRIIAAEQRAAQLNYNNSLCFEQFKHSHIKLKNLNQYSDIYHLDDSYDVFIAGSDQIWNPNLFNSYFFLSFTDKKKISYASSIGSTFIPDDIKIKMQALLSSFSAISVREDVGKQLIEDISTVPVEVVLDPTLLLSKSEWINVASFPESEGYILCYFLESQPWYYQYARTMATQLSKKLIVIPNRSEHLYEIETYDKNVGPSEFIGLINNSDVVLTDSFHGLAFSILFQKKFILIKRFLDKDDNNQNSRIFNLLKIIKLENRYIEEKEFSATDITYPDYPAINNIIKKEQERSITYLKGALNINE